MIENSKNYNKILEKSQKVRYKENDVDEFFQNLKIPKSIFKQLKTSQNKEKIIKNIKS